MDIVKAVTSLGLPQGQFVVVGSSSLAVLGIIDSTDDIDLAVSREVYDLLRTKGWEESTGHGGKPVLQRDAVEAGIGYGEWGLDDLLADAFYINGIPFMSLEKVLSWKRAAGRPKDLVHIEQIETYLKNH